MKISFMKMCALILSLIMFIAVFYGCTQQNPSVSSGTSSGTTSAVSSASTELKGTIDMTLAMDSFPDAATIWAEKWAKEYPGVKLNIELTDGSALTVALEARIAADNMPDILTGTASDWFKVNTDKGYFRDVSHTEAWGKQLDACKKQYTSNKGTPMGVTNGVAVMLLYYNEDYFKKANISKLPTNFDELISISKQLKAAGYTPFSIAGAGANNLCHSFVTHGFSYAIMASGYDVDWSAMAMTGEYDFGTAEWQKMLVKFAILRDNGFFQIGYESADYTEAIRVFNAGEAAMTIQTSAQVGSCLDPDSPYALNCMVPPWNDAGQDIVGVLSAENGFMLGKNKKGNEKLTDLCFDWFALKNYAVYQNLSGSIPPFAINDVPDVKVDKRVQAAANVSLSAKLQTSLAFACFPSPTYEMVKQFVQAVASGKAEPSQIGEYLNAAQTEYAAGLGK